jgi:hypothetical protein
VACQYGVTAHVPVASPPVPLASKKPTSGALARPSGIPVDSYIRTSGSSCAYCNQWYSTATIPIKKYYIVDSVNHEPVSGMYE